MKSAFLVTVAFLVVGLTVLSIFVQWAACRIARVRVETVTVFRGAPVFAKRVFGAMFEIGFIPLGCSIAFDIPQFRARPLAVRLAIVLAGPLALLVIAALLLGVGSASHQMASGFLQHALGALHPRTKALDLIGRLAVAFSLSVPSVMGIVAAKLAAFTLLPIGGMSTAECVRQLLDPSEKHHYVTRFMTFSAFTAIFLGVLWLVAVIGYVLTGSA